MVRFRRLSTGIGIFRAALEPNDGVSPRRISQSAMPNGIGARDAVLAQAARFTIGIMLGIAVGLAPMTASAQSTTIYLQPKFLYNDFGRYSTPFRDTPQQAFADVQAIEDVTINGTTYTDLNLRPAPAGTTHPFDYSFDGFPYIYYYDQTACSQGQCSTTSEEGAVQNSYACPAGFGAGFYNSNDVPSKTTNELVACALTSPAAQPPPKDCKSCLGDPIAAATGQMLQTQTDYEGVSGLEFKRTYRSNVGFSASTLSNKFTNYSTAFATTPGACYPAYYSYGSASGFYCFPYIGIGGSTPTYGLATADGRYVQFSGPSNAITANADINERVTQITVGGVVEWRVQREDDTVEIYNTTGSLIQKTLRGGHSFTYTISTSSTPQSIAPGPGFVLTQSDAFGHTLSWQYNSAGHPTQMTDPAGGLYQYSYDASGNLSGVIYPDSSSKTYWYNESANTGGTNLPSALTGVTDESGVRYATFQYNSSGLAVNTQHAAGADSFTFNYVNPNSRTVVTDPLGTNRTYLFQQNVSYVQDTSQTQPGALGGTVTQSETYDASGNPASVTDYNGIVTNYVYDLTRNLETSRTEAYGTAQARTITTQWNPNWRQPSLITEPNRTTGFNYDTLGNVLTKTITDTTVTPHVVRTWTYTYDSYGRMLTADGPRTDVTDTTTYSYYTCTTGYQCGQLHTISNALSQVTTFNTYNAHGQPLTITDPNNVVTTLTYDTRQRLKSRQVGTETTSYTYYPTGLLKLVTLPDSSTVLYAYDAAHRLTDITDGPGNHIHYTLDAMGNRTAENSYDPGSTLHRTHTRVINALNRFYQDVNAAGTAAVTTTLGYDDDGNQTSIAAPLSRNTSKQYDALNRLKQITDPGSGITQFGYDGNNNLIQVTDPRNFTTTYQYTGFGDVKQQVSPDTGTSTNTYDSGGNLKTATDSRNAIATYAYDALNRVTQVAYSDQTINFTYDAGTNGKGRLTGSSDANHSLSWTYDSLGRVTGKGQTIGSVAKSVGYSYTNGDMTSMVTPSGQTITYGYTNHRVTSIVMGSTTILSAVTYDPFGPTTGWSWGNSTTTSRSFDTDGLQHQIVTAGATNGYAADNASRITGISDSGLSTNSWTFGYDLLERVTGGSSSAKSRGYTYDANSNRLTTTGTSSSIETIAPANNRLSSTSGGIMRTYGYDTAGNTTSYTGDTFTFNKRGRMSSSVVTGGTTNYIYNALGQMIEKSGNGGTTLLIYDEAGHLLGEYSSTGALVQETIWLGDMPIATLRPNGSTGCTSTICIFYIHTDHLGTPRKITRPSDNLLMWRWDPDTFGTVAPSGTLTYNLRFPGQYFLSESGLYYNSYRTYDPNMGRYIESDPIGLRGGVNPYAYVHGNPLNLTDPLGLWTGQIGINISFNILGIASGSISAGIVFDGHGNVGRYSEFGGGVSVGASASGGLVLHGSNGDTINDLNGPFANVSAGGGDGAYASSDGFIGYGANGQKVAGNGITIGAGVGASISETITTTQVHPISSSQSCP